MKLRSASSRILLMLLMLFSVAGSIHELHLAHATGTLSIDPPILTPSPSGTVVTVDVRVDGMDQFNSWDIEISSNTNALNGTAIDYSTQNIFSQQPLQQVSCVNGKNVGGSSPCTDPKMGIVEAQGLVFGSNLPMAPIQGVLFSIDYLAGNYNFTRLDFVVSGIFLAGNCTGSACDVLHDTFGSVYGTPPAPDFSLSIKDQSVSTPLGGSASTTLSVSSIHDFSGQVNFTYALDSNGPAVKFVPDNVTLSNSTSSAEILITTTPTTNVRLYHLTVNATSGSLTHTAFLSVNVQTLPDFKVGSAPGQIRLVQGSSGIAVITVSSDTGFTGNITLNLQTPILNSYNESDSLVATASLAQTSLVIGSRGSNSTILSVSIPLSFYGYKYQINITGTSTSNPALTHEATVIIIPPNPDLSPSISPSTLTVVAGHSSFATLSVSGVNYFVGYTFASSTMSGGTAKYNQSDVYLAIGKTISFSVNITIDSATIPGNYLALLTVTGQLASGVAIARSIAENIVVQSSGHLVVQLPTKILGLPIPIYFGILGGFAAIFVLLAALLYRKTRSDKDVWE